MKLPKLYSRTATGAVQEWEIEIDGSQYRSIAGQKDGKKIISAWTVVERKNIGKANETSLEEQAMSEAKSKWQKKIDRGYKEDINDIDNATFISPMLAKKWSDENRKKDVRKDWKAEKKVFSQPKLDGCLSGETVVEFKDGSKKTLKEVFDKKLSGKIKSFDEKKNRICYSEIDGHFKNSIDIQEKNHQWYLVELENGNSLKLTGNHRVYLPELKCWRRVDELTGNEKLLC
jgi:hypothetical protein